MFYRKFADPDDCWVININGGTTWAIMTAITNVNDQSPIGDVKEVSCDKSRNSVFPSVNGGKDDVVLFSQGFDDVFGPNDFIPMSGASRLAYMKVHQDVSFVLCCYFDLLFKLPKYMVLTFSTYHRLAFSWEKNLTTQDQLEVFELKERGENSARMF